MTHAVAHRARRPRRARSRLSLIGLSGLVIAFTGTGIAALGSGVAAAAPAKPVAVPAARPHWIRITPQSTDIIDDVGLVRGSDGVVHVLWTTDGPGLRRITDSPVSAKGAKLPSATIATFFLTTDPDAVITKSGLTVAWNGIKSDVPNPVSGTFEATRPLAGGHWSVSGSHVAPLPAIPFTSSSDTAANGSDGKPFVAFDGTDSLTVVHLGHPEVELGPTNKCCVEQPGLATDSVSGRTWITYASIISGHQGIFARPLAASGQPAGPARLLPGSVTSGHILQPHQRVGTTSRGHGHAGVYALYEHGYPFARALWVTKLGSASPHTVATLGRSVTLINTTLAADSSGALYAAWVLANPAQLFITRSNAAATKFGPVLRVPLPAGTSTAWKVYLSVKAGHADVFVLATLHGKSKQTAYWHARISPRKP